MRNHSFDDLRVKENNKSHWHTIVENEGIKNEAFVVPIIRQIIIRASDEKTFKHITTPSKKGWNTNSCKGKSILVGKQTADIYILKCKQTV